MADLKVLAPFILSFEGGYSNHKNDRGGATNKGVTLATWKVCGYDKDGDGDIDENDVKLITEKDAVDLVMRPHFWDKCGGDFIHDQSVANALVDWAWNSGKAVPVKAVQAMLGLVADGVVGPKTIAAINKYPRQEKLFDAIQQSRIQFIERIIEKNPSQEVFRKGWMRRINSIRYQSLILNNGTVYAV